MVAVLWQSSIPYKTPVLFEWTVKQSVSVSVFVSVRYSNEGSGASVKNGK